jgi:two-component system capsular synthesis response regulator RcsB
MPKEPNSDLTLREIQILRMVVNGNTSKEISFKLGLSAKTISCHRLNAMRKLNIHSLRDVILYGIAHGWLVVSAGASPVPGGADGRE